MSDRLLGGFLVLLALGFIASALGIEEGLIFDSLGPKAFPILIAVVLITASLYPLLRPDPEPDWPPATKVAEIALTVGVLIVYALLITPLGFVAATTLGAAFLSWRLGGKPMWVLPTGLAIALGIYTVFHLILGLSLARGPWGF